MSAGTAELRFQIETLAARFEEWSRLIDLRRVPSRSVLENGLAIREDFERLRSALTTLASELHTTIQADELIGESCQALEQALDAIEQSEAARRRRLESALATIERVGSVVSIEGSSLPCLEALHTRTATLHAQLKTSVRSRTEQTVLDTMRDELEALDAFAQFLMADELPNEAWEELRAKISNAFGTELAAAAARGKLKFSAVSTESDRERPNSPVPVEVSENPTVDGPVDIDGAISIEKETNVAIETRMDTAEVSAVAPALESLDKHKVDISTHTDAKVPAGTKEIEIPRDANSRQLALEFHNCLEGQKGLIVAQLAWQLILEGNSALAYQLLRIAEKMAGDGPAGGIPSSWSVRAAIVGPRICEPNGEIASVLGADLRRIDWTSVEGLSAELRDSSRLLVAAATLRPSVVAPIATGAPAILESIYQIAWLTNLYQLSSEVAKVTKKLYSPLDPASLKGARNRAAWQEEMERLSAEADQWCQRAAAANILYAPATKVWRAWIDKTGAVGRMLAKVRENSALNRTDVENGLSQFRDEKKLEKLLRDTHRRINPHITNQIEARALRQLRLHLDEACQFAQRWLDLQAVSPDGPERFEQERAAELRNIWERLGGTVLRQLDQALGESHPRSIKASLLCCRNGVQRLEELFDPRSEVTVRDVPSYDLLEIELLRIPGIHLNKEWKVEGDYGKALEHLVAAVSVGLPSWQEAFDACSEERNHEATGRIIAHLQAEQECEELDLTSVRQQRIKQCRDALGRDIEQVRKQLEEAVAFGLVRENDRTDLVASIESIEQNIETIERFSPEHQRLEGIRQGIAKERNSEVQQARYRLTELGDRLLEGSEARIATLLDQGDVFTATEYLDMAERGISLPSTQVPERAFNRFFPLVAQSVLNFLESSRPAERDLIADIRSQRGVPGVPMNNVPGAQAQEASEMLRIWLETKRTQRISEESARFLLERLGFSPEKLQITATSRRGGRLWLSFNQTPIEDRERCPVAAFGSQARGQYRVLCLWQRLTDEGLLDEVGDTSYGTPPIVFYFNRMTEKVRRDLAQASRKRGRCFVVLDELLLLFLSGERGSRLKAFYDCALPFTKIEPYVTTASYVPPEVFYGREREKQSLIDPMGSCFIFGGRQLGKTALLRDVERSFHRPEEGRIALWLDLKASGIGTDKPLDDLFTSIGKTFRTWGVVPSTTPQSAGPATIIDHISNWISADKKRRILLLLDEADRFLEQDTQRDKTSEQFLRADRLKGLMDRTERRFKVVFAGLHNVQRTTKLANHPLAHFGEPICIGPLLDDGQWKEARRLIEDPLACAGYQFEPKDLVTRILSQTNYYPSLIQLYCTHLLRHLLAKDFNPNKTPPFEITSSHVEEVYRSRQLREGIRDRFIWTLQLDHRFHVIALSIALYRSDALAWGSGGLSVDRIFRDASTWWPEGFTDLTSEDAFRSLLDEMVGLGVLRENGQGRYALRSPNVAFLVGNEEEISRNLEEYADRKPTPEYEPGTFRGSYDENLRSPLTAQQESELRARRNGIAIVCGCESAGISEIQAYLKTTSDSEYFTVISDATDVRSFERSLDTTIKGRPTREGVMLVVVPSSAPWTTQWIDRAGRLSQQRSSKQSFARIVFVADPATVWRLLSDGYDPYQSESGPSLLVQSLGPWAEIVMRYWLDDLQIASQDERKQIESVTGRWPQLVYELKKKAHASHGDWGAAIASLREELANPDGARKQLASFGLQDPRLLRSLGIACEFYGFREEPSELAKVAEVDAAQFESAMKFAQILSFAKPDPVEGHKIDETVARLLKQARMDI